MGRSAYVGAVFILRRRLGTHSAKCEVTKSFFVGGDGIYIAEFPRGENSADQRFV